MAATTARIWFGPIPALFLFYVLGFSRGETGMLCRSEQGQALDGNDTIYIGCYNVSCMAGDGRFLLDMNMDIERCANFCRASQSTHAALTIGILCLCGDLSCNVTVLNETRCDSKCGLPCEPYDGNFCGGFGYAQVYNVSIMTPSTLANGSSTNVSIMTSSTQTNGYSTKEDENTTDATSCNSSGQTGSPNNNLTNVQVSLIVFIIASYVLFIGIFFRQRKWRRKRCVCGRNIANMTFPQPGHAQLCYVNVPYQEQRRQVVKRTYRSPARKLSRSLRKRISTGADGATADADSGAQQPDLGNSTPPSCKGHVIYSQSRPRRKRLSLKMKHTYLKRSKVCCEYTGAPAAEVREMEITASGNMVPSGEVRAENDRECCRLCYPARCNNHEKNPSHCCPAHASYQRDAEGRSSNKNMHGPIRRDAIEIESEAEEEVSIQDDATYANFPPPRPRAFTDVSVGDHSTDIQRFPMHPNGTQQCLQLASSGLTLQEGLEDASSRNIFTAAYHLGTIMKSCGELGHMMFKDIDRTHQSLRATECGWSSSRERDIRAPGSHRPLPAPPTDLEPLYSNYHAGIRPGRSCGEFREMMTTQDPLDSPESVLPVTTERALLSCSCDRILNRV